MEKTMKLHSRFGEGMMFPWKTILISIMAVCILVFEEKDEEYSVRNDCCNDCSSSRNRSI